jgi:hypothetical protein
MLTCEGNNLGMAQRPVPQVLYKFAKRKWAHAMCSAGIFRIGTLYDFRREEHAECIADKDEGKRNTFERIAKTILTAESQSWVSKSAMTIMPGIKVEVKNSTFTAPSNSPDCFLYCFSETSESSAVSTNNYDAVVQITNPVEFAHHLAVAAHLSRIIVTGQCRYIGRHHEIGNDPDVAPVFLKPESFCFQREWRSVWEVPAGRVAQPFLVHAPDARKYCRLMPMR